MGSRRWVCSETTTSKAQQVALHQSPFTLVSSAGGAVAAATVGGGCWNRRKNARLLCHLFLLLLALVYASLLRVGTLIQKRLPSTPPDKLLAKHFSTATLERPQDRKVSIVTKTTTTTTMTNDNNQQQPQVTEQADKVNNDEPFLLYQDTLSMTSKNLWDASSSSSSSSRLPKWMKDYFTWHQQQRALLVMNNSTNWNKKFRYLIVQCRRRDRQCGGTADRLKPIPYLVLIAAQTQRLLLIQWERPHALEEFLVPPEGGLDWRMPKDLVLTHHHRRKQRPVVSNRGVQQHVRKRPNDVYLFIKYQSFNSGEDYYDEHRRQQRGKRKSTDNNDDDEDDEPTFAQVYPYLWRIMFTPAPPIAALIAQQLRQMQLVPRSYIAAHIRTNYGEFGQLGKEESLEYYMNKWSKASIRCASQLLPRAPILIVSDSIETVQMTMEYGNRAHATSLSTGETNQATRVVSRLATASSTTSFQQNSSSQIGQLQQQQQQQQAATPLHLDKADDWQNRSASEYYDTFVDLYLMAMARCVVYNIGGFGHWAMLIGAYNVTACGLQYYDIFRGFHPCINNKKITNSSSLSSPHATQPDSLVVPQQLLSRHRDPLFLPPMKNNNQRITGLEDVFVPRYHPLPVEVESQTVDRHDGFADQSSVEESVDAIDLESSSGALQIEYPNHELITTPGNNSSLVPFSWETSPLMPSWMKQYFLWHRMQRARITKDNWRDFRYMVVRCRQSRRCGGTADRLKPIPFFLLIAYQSQRLLMINWERPKPLEDFLVPPKGGIDWRVPDYLVLKIARSNYPKNTLEQILRTMNKTDAISLNVRYQSFNSGADYYDQARPGGGTFAEVYHDVWHAMFTPTPPIAKRIEEQMEKLRLIPGQYVAAHVRSNYTTDAQSHELKLWTRNSINCASQLMPGATTFFASDSSQAVDLATAFGKEQNARVVARPHDTPPLHLETAKGWESRPASDYYDTFVDLYLLGMSRCVTYNQGGFGSWASLISFNSSCSMRHHHANGVVEHCEWKAPTIVIEPQLKFQRPLFADPMALPNLWDSATTVPNWMKKYFAWHAEQLANLNADNWDRHRFLVVVCLQKHPQCGGVSDRLKPLPVLLLIAYRTKRLLMIWWERPFDLEEFFVPPSGGLDWRVPTWLRPLVIQEGKLTSNLHALLATQRDPTSIIQVLYQSGNAGGVYFNQTQDSKTTYEQVFHELFRIVFTPSPALAEVIDETMKQNNLVAGEYASAHLRAMYGRTHRDPNEVKYLAVNAALCASKLRPGGPIYFAGDSKLAVEAVRAFAAKRSLPIAALDYQGEVLHLDKDSKNQTKSLKPADFFPTFVDLYLLAQSRCVAYSNGGFGTFGLMLSYNSTCSLRHFRRRRTTQNCRWQTAKK